MNYLNTKWELIKVTSQDSTGHELVESYQNKSLEDLLPLLDAQKSASPIELKLVKPLMPKP